MSDLTIKEMQNTLKRILADHKNILENIPRVEMIKHSVDNKEALISANGNLVTWTPPESTGRSPKDTLIVKRAESEDTIDWSSPNCIPLDPFYLTWKAREYGYHTRLIELAGEINNDMPQFVITKLMRLLNEKGLALSKSNILLLGAAYKKDIEDMRESPVQDLIVLLEKNSAKFDYNDPHVPTFHNELNDKHYTSVGLESIEDYDAVIIVTDHTAYDYDDIVKRSKLVLDTRFACNGRKAENLVRM